MNRSSRCTPFVGGKTSYAWPDLISLTCATSRTTITSLTPYENLSSTSRKLCLTERVQEMLYLVTRPSKRLLIKHSLGMNRITKYWNHNDSTSSGSPNIDEGVWVHRWNGWTVSRHLESDMHVSCKHTEIMQWNVLPSYSPIPSREVGT